jgi:UDP-2,3-diacylglucosamine pyrophosphatase LpxH
MKTLTLVDGQKIKVVGRGFEYGDVCTLKAYCEKNGIDYAAYVERNKNRRFLDGSSLLYAWGNKLNSSIDNSGHSFAIFCDYRDKSTLLVHGDTVQIDGANYRVKVFSGCFDFVHFIPVV